MGYFDDTCFAPCEARRPFIVPGVNHTITVLNEAALLGFEPGEIQIGDDIIIIQPTSRTLAWGIVKYVNPLGSGWGQFTVMGLVQGIAVTDDEMTNWLNTLPLAPPVGGGWWNDGGSPTYS